MEHTSINCPKRKNINPLESTNNSNSFVRKIEYLFTKPINNLILSLETLIDTESHISLVREEYVPTEFIESYSFLKNYYGINKSKLIVIRIVKCKIIFENQEFNKDFFVVPNETMEYPAILGTDFLEEERFVLIKESILRLENKVSKDESKQNMEKLIRLLYDKEEKLPNKKNLNEYNELYLNQNEEIESECQNLMAIELDTEENTLIIYNTNIHLKQQIFKQYYLNTEIPKKPDTKCHLKLILNNEKPFHYKPRR